MHISHFILFFHFFFFLGGVTLLRAAAKNHSRVTILCDPRDYDAVIESMASSANSTPSLELRQKLAVKVKHI